RRRRASLPARPADGAPVHAPGSRPAVPANLSFASGKHFQPRDGGGTIAFGMNEVTQLLDAVTRGDAQAAEQLLPLVYEELRRLAAGYLDREQPGHTLQPTALVHEAYIRLVGGDADAKWYGRAHFLATAALAMRHILIDNARRKQRDKRGGDRQRVELSDP